LKERFEKEKDIAVENSDFEAAKEAFKLESEYTKKLDKLQKEWNKKNKNKMIVIEKEDIATVVSDWTGIPVTQLSKEEKQKIKTLSDDLKLDVKGQNDAVETIAKAIRRNKAGLKEPNRPVGAFLLLGPTGVGKTELAKSLAKHVYGSEENMIRFDMSEFMESHSVSKLVGAPPGYVGYDDEGKLTKLLRRKPYSLVLFDEVEKAHPEVMNIFLQLFEDGRITDSKGRVISAKNAIFLMTSNAGSEAYSKKGGLGFSSSVEVENTNLKNKVNEALKKQFKPEFLNRLDNVIIFNRLTEPVMVEIAEKMTSEVTKQMKENGFDIKFNKAAIEHLAEIGFDPEYGARTLRRKIADIKDMISDKIFDDEATSITVNVRKKGEQKEFYVK
jgi:ATP-dependent Clp protease ATP-binding subunit ClpC